MRNVADELENIVNNVMSGLKDFQKKTVEHIDSLYRSGQKRILVSDEVGLGKTLIARGTIAKVAKLRQEEGDELVKVAYICSNSTIADQNLRKLRITSEVQTDDAGSSRLSMQHLKIFEQESDSDLHQRYIQLIPLTPDTSFRMTNGSGTVSERALMFAVLRKMPALKNYLPELEVLMADRAISAWHYWCRNYYMERVENCNKLSKNAYLDFMMKQLDREMNMEREGESSYLDILKDELRKIRNGLSYDRGIIGRLRHMFAEISVARLEPDLVIMDEFQRFKYLIDTSGVSEVSMLANKFFNTDGLRILLLSATPYKMYSTMEEIDEDQVDAHYSEFFKVIEFLSDTQPIDDFQTIWEDYSVKLKELVKGDTAIIEVKKNAENELYKWICRTERYSEHHSADMIDDSDVKIPLKVSEADIRSYLQIQELLSSIDEPYNAPVDFVKSSPYLMSFMNDYKLKKLIEKYFKTHPNEVSKMKRETFWLNKKAIDRFDKIPNNNARLDRVMEKVFSNNAELLLWVPPSLPYYKPEGVFRNAGNFSKTLIFSSWEMVPRMLSMLLSYEAERKTTGAIARRSPDREAKYFLSGDKRYPSARFNFVLREKKPAAMTLFCLIYPSKFLAQCYEPMYCLRNKMSLREIESSVRGKIGNALDKMQSTERGLPDARWYYIAPMLMDGADHAEKWLDSEIAYARSKNADKELSTNSYLRHIEEYRRLFQELKGVSLEEKLGKKPDDLLEVLTDMAIASPAICAYRTYKRYRYPGSGNDPSLPSQVARQFINRMNTPESTAVIMLSTGRRSDDAHWQNVLSYCKDGNFQAMFDEYAHLISNNYEERHVDTSELHKTILDSMQIKTTSYNADTYESFLSSVRYNVSKDIKLRTHFAISFTKGDSDESSTDRKKKVRNAFNSPFRPFVLASTSIGQEGLDFHNYCRRIVHWNLPSNPIDIEQREGRINRFECLAIRQNIAERYGSLPFLKDPWREMFRKACAEEKAASSSDLLPFWGLKNTEDMIRIERIVPMYPFSRDQNIYGRLMKILSLYRLALGQPRQEELIEHLLNNKILSEDDAEKLFINLSPFYRDDE